jgi:hypothetical protein
MATLVGLCVGVGCVWICTVYISVCVYILFGGALVAFLGGLLYSHKMKGRETLSRSCKDFNTAEDSTELTENLSTSTELQNMRVGICNGLLLKFLLII